MTKEEFMQQCDSMWELYAEGFWSAKDLLINLFNLGQDIVKESMQTSQDKKV